MYAFSPDGRTLAAGEYGLTLRLWDVFGPHFEARTLKSHSGVVTSVAFSPDGMTLFTAGTARAIRLWDTVTLQQRFTIPHESSIDCMAVSTDGNLVASSERNGIVRFWRAATKDEVRVADR